MCKDIRFLVVLVSATLMFLSCAGSSFSVSDATHQKYVLSESEVETVIRVYIDDLPETAEIRSIVFNRVKVPATTETINGRTVVTGIIKKGITTPDQVNKQSIVDEPNQIIYTIDGKSDYINLSNIRFLPSKMKLM